MKFELIIGKYVLSMNQDGYISLWRNGGEAMETKEGKLEKMLDKFWEEEF